MKTDTKSSEIQFNIHATVKSTEKADWTLIVANVKKRHKIKNWLTEVRGPLQALLSSGKIKRTDDVRKEEYYATDR